MRFGEDVILFHNDSPTLLEVMSLSSRLRHLLDRFGATGSMLCAVHCAVIPVLLAAAPSLGLSFWLSDGVEQALVVFVTLLGLFSLVSYRRHGALRALGLIPGLVALWAGVLYDPLHHNAVPHAVVMTIGGLRALPTWSTCASTTATHDAAHRHAVIGFPIVRGASKAAPPNPCQYGVTRFHARS